MVRLRFAWIGAALALPSLLAAGSPVWREVKTKDFTLVSDASPRDLVDFAVRYTAFRDAFRLCLDPRGAPLPRSTIVLFRRNRDLRQYAVTNLEDLSSYSADVDDRVLFALALDGDRDQAMRTTIEFDTSFMLREMGYFLPLWVTQGSGEVMSTLYLESGRCVLGGPRPELVDLLDENRTVPWERFVELSTDSREYQKTFAYQAQAWAVMRMVLLGGGTPAERFRHLTQQIHGDRTDVAAIADLAGTDVRGLTTALYSHLDRDGLLAIPFDDAGARRGIVVTLAPPAEIQALKAELLEMSGQTAQSDYAFLELARAAPKLALVQEGLARRALRTGDEYEAATDYRAAIAAGSDDPEAYLCSARERLDEDESGNRDVAGSGGPEIATAIGEIHHALVLAPGNRNAYLLLARAFYVSPTLTPAEVAELRPALKGDSDGMRLLFCRGLLSERLGHADQCVADLQAVIANSETPDDVRSQAGAHLGRVQFDFDRRKVESLVQDGKFGDAAALVQAGIANAGPLADTDDYRRLLDWIEQQEFNADQQDVEDRVQSHDFGGAFAVVDKALAGPLSPSAHAAFQKLKSWVRQNRDLFALADLVQHRNWARAIAAADALLATPLPPDVAERVQAERDQAEEAQAESKFAPAGP